MKSKIIQYAIFIQAVFDPNNSFSIIWKNHLKKIKQEKLMLEKQFEKEKVKISPYKIISSNIHLSNKDKLYNQLLKGLKKYTQDLKTEDTTEGRRLAAKIKISKKCLDSIRSDMPLDKDQHELWQKEFKDLNIFKKGKNFFTNGFSNKLSQRVEQLIELQQKDCMCTQGEIPSSSIARQPAFNPTVIPMSSYLGDSVSQASSDVINHLKTNTETENASKTSHILATSLLTPKNTFSTPGDQMLVDKTLKESLMSDSDSTTSSVPSSVTAFSISSLASSSESVLPDSSQNARSGLKKYQSSTAKLLENNNQKNPSLYPVWNGKNFSSPNNTEINSFSSIQVGGEPENEKVNKNSIKKVGTIDLELPAINTSIDKLPEDKQSIVSDNSEIPTNVPNNADPRIFNQSNSPKNLEKRKKTTRENNRKVHIINGTL